MVNCVVKNWQGEDVGETSLELKVAKGDVGKVIGKQGKTAEALRSIMKAASARSNRKIVLEIIV